MTGPTTCICENEGTCEYCIQTDEWVYVSGTFEVPGELRKEEVRMATTTPENCVHCGFPLPDGRSCSFCKADNMELKVEAMKKRMVKMQLERDRALEENQRLKDRISDLLLICEVEGRNPGVMPSPIDPNTAS